MTGTAVGAMHSAFAVFICKNRVAREISCWKSPTPTSNLRTGMWISMCTRFHIMSELRSGLFMCSIYRNGNLFSSASLYGSTFKPLYSTDLIFWPHFFTGFPHCRLEQSWHARMQNEPKMLGHPFWRALLLIRFLSFPAIELWYNQFHEQT